METMNKAMGTNNNALLRAEHIKIKFKDKEVINDFSVSIEKGRIYSIIGPNGSGKTTLLRTMSRNLKPDKGNMYLDGKSIFSLKTKKIARRLAVLSQGNNGITDVTVRNLVVYGRYAHKEWWQGSNEEDRKIVDWALETTGMKEYEKRKVCTLSGGERQRAWVAMAIAQKPEILLLDEPTTFLDICHQLELLELVSELNKEYGITVLMVLHDINQAARYSDELIVIKDGKLYTRGSPCEIITAEMLRSVFNVGSDISIDKYSGRPVFYPKKIQ